LKTFNFNKSIVASQGIYKNHVRWLLLLSSYFDEAISDIKEVKMGKTTELRLDFITQLIYSSDRNCFNWLEFEWDYRLYFDKVINLHYSIESMLELNVLEQHKILGMYSTPEHCLHAYAKYDPCLWLNHIDQLRMENFAVQNYKSKENEDCLKMNAHILTQPTLDETFYSTIVNFFGIDNVYESANKLHGTWYSLIKKAEEEAYEFFSNATYPDWPWQPSHTKIFNLYQTFKPKDELRWQKAKETIMLLYKPGSNLC
jgi:hypothetical protein